MKKESFPFNRRSAARAAAFITGIGVGMSVLTGCDSGNSTVYVTPQQVNLPPQDGSCQHPCSIYVYKQPKVTKDFSATDGYINRVQVEEGTSRVWPHEAGTDPTTHKKLDASKLKVVCQVMGQAVFSADGTGSRLWDVIEVPVNEINDYTNQQAEAAQPSFGVVKADSTVLKIYAFAPDEFLGNRGINHNLPACTIEEVPS